MNLPRTAPLRVRLFPRERQAVSCLFFVNGFVVGSLAPKIPELGERLGISESVLGLLILCFGLGSLTMMPFVGPAIARFGSARPARIAAALLAPTILWLTLAPNIALAGFSLFLLGGFAGAMDIAMNANAVSVEQKMRRAVMSSCHGFWSLGGFAGAAGGGLVLQGAGSTAHAAIVTAIAAAFCALAWRRVFEDRPAGDIERKPIRLPRTPLPYLVGLMALFSMVPEGAILDWGALYLRQAFAVDIAASGLAFGAFSAAMALTRFAGDTIRNRFGATATLRASAILAFAGIFTASIAPQAGLAVAGFAIAGIGIANMAPILFSAAGNLPGMAPGIGLSVVTFMGYSGLLVAPATIGFVAERTGFAVIYAVLAVLIVTVAIFSGQARHADMR